MKSERLSEQVHCNSQDKGYVEAAARIIGNKWNPILLYSLSQGCCRFSALQSEMGGINPRTLSARLDEFEVLGLIQKVTYAEVPPRVVYTLTDKGKDLLPILDRMREWGKRYGQLSLGENGPAEG
jgi:DNA-binding HxlR family transcriptional regulator